MLLLGVSVLESGPSQLLAEVQVQVPVGEVQVLVYQESISVHLQQRASLPKDPQVLARFLLLVFLSKSGHPPGYVVSKSRSITE